MNGALFGITAGAIGALALGVLARCGCQMGLEQWTVGGRSFGLPFVFLLMAGEICTTFTFLGGSGFAYGKGGPAYYILSYATLAYVVSYFMLPPIWRYAKDHALYSQPDFFSRKYDCPMLGLLVSLVGIVALIPYSGVAVQGAGHHRRDSRLWRDPFDACGMDRRGDRHRLCHSLGMWLTKVEHGALRRCSSVISSTIGYFTTGGAVELHFRTSPAGPVRRTP